MATFTFNDCYNVPSINGHTLGGASSGGTINYESLTDKPSINGVMLGGSSGSGQSYNDAEDKTSINGVLLGDEPSTDYELLLQYLKDNNWYNTSYVNLKHIIPFAYDSTYVGILQEKNDVEQFPLKKTTKDLGYTHNSIYDIPTQISSFVVSCSLTYYTEDE